MRSEHSNDPEVKVIRSPRRRRTIQARVVNGVVEIRIPAAFSRRQEDDAVADMLARMRAKSTSQGVGDAELEARAHQLNASVLAGRAEFTSIRWVSNQNTRWGSCTPSTGQIRISDRLKDVPAYVLDAVVVHELTHTFIPGHGPEFWEWADRAPRAERAKGYLEALQRHG
ncbi:M48 family metallopeptidase [Corynebacterium sp.]|uniref:M48 metallopeptidase family protein n=1 Tax=Corynebacterium sp. TaxID=1720 RepID=UPI002A910677|nr:SprT-like domain-containing protein [Corynebacterium sp.]MDY5786360.1 YgjP-like metallopeptidase domain-containing protein [Corynebacterium sp.]